MMAWFDERLSAFDVESTGVDPENDRIVQSAIVSVGAGQPTRRSVLLIDPGVPIPDGAAEVHGITTARAQAEGSPAAGAIAALAVAITTVIKRGRPLAVTNAPFDLTMLDRECRRYGVESPPWEKARIVDPLVIDKHLDRYRKGSRKLADACAAYGAGLVLAHDAGDDALATARMAWVLGAKGQVIRKVWNAEMGREKAALVREWERVRYDIDLLHAAQARWKREQAISLREHFREKGQHDDAASVREYWPLVPVVEAVAS